MRPLIKHPQEIILASYVNASIGILFSFSSSKSQMVMNEWIEPGLKPVPH